MLQFPTNCFVSFYDNIEHSINENHYEYSNGSITTILTNDKFCEENTAINYWKSIRVNFTCNNNSLNNTSNNTSKWYSTKLKFERVRAVEYSVFSYTTFLVNEFIKTNKANTKKTIKDLLNYLTDNSIPNDAIEIFIKNNISYKKFNKPEMLQEVKLLFVELNKLSINIQKLSNKILSDFNVNYFYITVKHNISKAEYKSKLFQLKDKKIIKVRKEQIEDELFKEYNGPSNTLYKPSSIYEYDEIFVNNFLYREYSMFS